MTLKKQVSKLKENWLLIVLPIVLIFLFMFLSNGNATYYLNKGVAESPSYAGGADGDYYGRGVPSTIYPPYPSGNFDPTLSNRKITKTASLSTQVEHGDFMEAEGTLKAIVTSSGSFLINENTNANDQSWKTYKSGSYILKVDTDKYDSVITQLKTIGEIISFNENADDVTEIYSDANKELAAEKSKLKKYQELYAQNISPTEKVNLITYIFEQERRITYLEEQLKNLETRVDYSTLTVYIQEKRSEYSDIAFARISELVKAFVASINSVLYLIVMLLPYVIVIGLIWLIAKKVWK